jgi:PKD repeat protein
MGKSLYILLLLFPYTLLAQKEASNWYFGDRAGIQFNPAASALTNGQMSADEGCSSISDTNGMLLFYSNGINVWNRNHVIMSNGSGLAGHLSSTTSCHIVPQPDGNLYYIFTTDAVENNLANGLRYSIVDMSANGGLGSVISKNNLLLQFSCEKITSVYHNNGTDLWVMAHGFGNNTFFAYLLTGAGLNTTPVQTSIGSILRKHISDFGSNSYSAIGYMKFSHDGTKLANAVFGILNRTELFDFNNSTGKLSNLRTLPGPPIVQGLFLIYGGAYGIEFSPNDSMLYVSTVYMNTYLLDARGWVYQYQIFADDQTIINNSATIIIQSNGVAYGAMQLAPDCRIYVSKGSIRGSQGFIDVVANPNWEGSGCDYLINGFNLNGRTPGFGLPQVFRPCGKADFIFISVCPGDTVQFQDKSTPPVKSWLWDFGDPASGVLNSSSEKNPAHIYNVPGSYQVKLVVLGRGFVDSVSKFVTISQPVVDLGNDTTVCPGVSVLLDAGNTNAIYRWWYKPSPAAAPVMLYLGKAFRLIIRKPPGTYWVDVTINNCTVSDTIRISNFPPITDELGNDTTLCAGQSIVIHAGNDPGADYSWSTGEITESILADTAALYSVTITKNGCTEKFDKQVTFALPQLIDIGKDSTLCAGQQITLSVNLSNATFLWSNGSTASSITVEDSGRYWLDVNYFSCPTASDTIAFKYIEGIEYIVPNLITPDGDGHNDEFQVLNLIPNTSLVVCNIWGNEVYKSKDYPNDWRADKVRAGIYYYYLSNDNICIKDYKGWLHIEK